MTLNVRNYVVLFGKLGGDFWGTKLFSTNVGYMGENVARFLGDLPVISCMMVIFRRGNDNTFVRNVTDPINIKPKRYLVWRFDIHVFSTKVSMHNVSTVKVVTNRRDLRQKHHYVLLLTLSSKNVIFESAIHTVGTWDLTKRWSRVMIFPIVTRRNSEKNPTAFTSFRQLTRLLYYACKY